MYRFCGLLGLFRLIHFNWSLRPTDEDDKIREVLALSGVDMDWQVLRSCWPTFISITLVLLVGCKASEFHKYYNGPPTPDVSPGIPRELEKITQGDYRVGIPDILLIEAFKGVPKPPHKVEPLDVLSLQLANPLPNDPLQGLFSVDPDGTINLGPTYGGALQVAGLAIPEVKLAIERHMMTAIKLKDPVVSVNLAQTRAIQRVSGAHLIRSDGTIGLGVYGSVRVVGLTLAEVKAKIEEHLSEYLLEPGVIVDVQGYNSKLVYVVLDGAGAGQTVIRLPFTGNDTVLDAISQVNGLSSVSSTDKIWVARPGPAGTCHQILPVNWLAVASAGETTTNYQLMPGDRVYIASQTMVRVDTMLSRAFAPLERTLGIVLLGKGAFQSSNNNNINGR
jgi:polysaccharide export outer membrane protein